LANWPCASFLIAAARLGEDLSGMCNAPVMPQERQHAAIVPEP
jgi:hypothetical protein